MAHIHIGQHHTAGGIAVWLCGNPDVATGIPPGTPLCPKAGGVVSGMFTATAVVGPAAQLVAPGELAEVLKAIRSGAAYVNVHTLNVRAGEIRGQLRSGDGHGKEGRGHMHEHH
jgi:hypothetical protein